MLLFMPPKVLTTRNLATEVQIMACTADEDAVGYLNDIDERFRSAWGSQILNLGCHWKAKHEGDCTRMIFYPLRPR